ncbi:DUF2003 domain-containing protein [bacterium]|nr:DUF2003 domain-containing protein [bacterium]
MEKNQHISGSEVKFDPISMEFREIISYHLRLLKSLDNSDQGDLDRVEKVETTNRQNLNVIAYCISFLIFKFIDVDPFVQRNNIAWASKALVRYASMTDRGRKLDKNSYYFLKDKLRDYLKSINSELTRIDGQPIDVWQHGYDKLDNELKKKGILKALE